jgi:pimeloyl-ACP methyl ester carboxylesterase
MLGKPALTPSPRGQWVVALLFLVFMLSALHSLLLHHPDKAGCDHVWMYPTYTKLTGFNRQHTRLGDKYTLYLYRDDYYQRLESGEFKPNGIPVIFIPGNAGSYKQARSIGSLAAEAVAERGLSADMQLDLFTADFQEDFTAFHGRTLLDQAEYVNDAIKFILNLYDNPNPATPHPKSVIVIGHSMGGFIARTLVGLDNYTPESVNTILTLASPHVLPPLTFDAELTNVYQLVNRYWAEAHSAEMVGRSPLSSVALVSIAGGKPDNMVPSDYAAVSEFARPSHAFAAFSYGIPGVWTGIDHQAMVWCHQARVAIVNALLEIVDSESPSKTKSLEARMRVFAKYFLSGFEPYPYNTKSVVPLATLPEAEVTAPVEGPMAIISPTTQTTKSTLIKVNFGSGVQIFSNVSDVDIQLCSANLLCRRVDQDALKVPHSSPYFQEPFQSGYKMKQPSTFAYYLEYTPAQLNGVSYISVIPKTSLAENDYIVINTGVKQREIEVGASYMVFGGISVQVPAGQATDISLRGATSSLLSYTVEIVDAGQKISKSLFRPFVRQYVLDPFESKFHVNVFGKARRAFVFFHGLDSPFIGHLARSANNTQKNNLHVHVFTPPTTHAAEGMDANFEVRIRLDVWGTLGNLIPRYRTILIPFSIAVVLSVILIQLYSVASQGSSTPGAGLKKKRNVEGVPTFSQGLQTLIQSFLPVGVPVLVILQLLMSFRPVRFVVNLILQAPFLFRNGGVYTTATHLIAAASDHSNDFVGTLVPGNPFIVGIVTNRSNLLLLFIAPLLAFVALGMTVTVHGLIMGLVNGLVHLLANASPRGRLRPDDKKDKPTVSASIINIRGRQVSYLWLTATGLALLITKFYAPYPLAYTISVVYFLYLVILAKLNRQHPHQGLGLLQNDTVINFAESLLMLLLWTVPLGIPVVISWVHTLIENSFWQPCSSHRNVVNIIPLLLVLYIFQTHYLSASPSRSIVSSSSPVISSSSKYAAQMRTWGATFFGIFMAYIIFYAVMLGFNHTYMLFHLVNIALVCVAVYGILLSI